MKGELPCTKDEAAHIASIQLRIEETSSQCQVTPSLNVYPPSQQKSSTLSVPSLSSYRRSSVSDAEAVTPTPGMNLSAKGSSVTLTGSNTQIDVYGSRQDNIDHLPAVSQRRMKPKLCALPPHLQQSHLSIPSHTSNLMTVKSAVSSLANVSTNFGSQLARRSFSASSASGINSPWLGIPGFHNMQSRVRHLGKVFGFLMFDVV